MNYPLISVIVPIYNSEVQLSRCIDSLIGQTYKNLEIILVDDGSKDSSWHICQEYEKKDERVKAFHKHNGGVSSARNFGMKLAVGEYIGFLDSDDYVAPELYSDLVDILNSNDNIDGIKYQLRGEIGNKFVEPSPSNHPGPVSLDNKLFAMQLILDQEFASAVCFLFKKSIINHSFNENINIAEDYLFLMHFIMHARKVYITNTPYYYYTYNENSIMHSYTNPDRAFSYLKSQLTVCRIAKRYIEKYELDDLRLLQEHDVGGVIRNNIGRLFPDISYKDYVQYIRNVRMLKEFKYFNKHHKYDSYLNSKYSFYLKNKLSRKGKLFIKGILKK